MSRVLVAAASKHGSTQEIAEALGRTLATAGHQVDVRAPSDVVSVRGYDACVLGSGVYAGHWLPDARGLVDRTADELVAMPVWLFSSGPVGEPLKPHDDAVDVGHLQHLSAAREHHLFAGRIDRDRLSFPERALVRALRVECGDFRDWDEVEQWGRSIAVALERSAV
ncbi:MAG: Flavodoxin-like protein [Frankiales bacterium]|nr:Flavodoxin-like protein [Frankiales bacterium]